MGLLALHYHGGSILEVCVCVCVCVSKKCTFFLQMEKQNNVEQEMKKKSRKQKRKVRNLRKERISGRGHIQGDSAHKPAWLETHIWHAKRMKMSDYHGYRVAEKMNDKGVRQAYLSMRYGCLLSVSQGLNI